MNEREDNESNLLIADWKIRITFDRSSKIRSTLSRKLLRCETMAETVQFDVGGKVFRVARSLIEQHDQTMLARLVSERWQTQCGGKKDGRETKPIFIDRNGDNFGFVLDYLRYGKVNLPCLVPKENFLRDLDYFGVAVVKDDDTVRSDSVARIRALTRTLMEARGEIAMIYIASSFCKLHIVSQLQSSGSGPIHVQLNRNNAELKSYTGVDWGIVDATAKGLGTPGKNKQMFDQYLAHNGLAVTGNGLKTHGQSIWATLITVPFSSAGSK
jgi:hypothetical protein